MYDIKIAIQKYAESSALYSSCSTLSHTDRSDGDDLLQVEQASTNWPFIKEPFSSLLNESAIWTNEINE